MSDSKPPLSGLRVVEFTHAALGPSCGLFLADMGAQVIRVEPPAGDPTRRLKGFGAGYFPFLNRNKRSLAIDLKEQRGTAVVLATAATERRPGGKLRPRHHGAAGAGLRGAGG